MLGRFWRRPLGSKLIVLMSLVLFGIWAAAPWQRPCAATVEGPQCGRVFAWEGHDAGLLVGLLTLAVLVWELLPVLWGKLSMRGWSTAVVQVGLSGALAVVTLIKLIVDNEFQQLWAWAAFALSLLILLTAVMRVRYRWDHRRRERLEGEVASARADAEAARAEAARLAGPPPAEGGAPPPGSTPSV